MKKLGAVLLVVLACAIGAWSQARRPQPPMPYEKLAPVQNVLLPSPGEYAAILGNHDDARRQLAALDEIALPVRPGDKLHARSSPKSMSPSGA